MWNKDKKNIQGSNLPKALKTVDRILFWAAFGPIFATLAFVFFVVIVVYLGVRFL
jgi:hypothetical protein